MELSFVRERVKGLYSTTGRPSIDPEVLLRLLLVGYLYGITSERRLLEEVRMHLAYRWFTRLDFGQDIPDHSTFSKNRHGRAGFTLPLGFFRLGLLVFIGALSLSLNSPHFIAAVFQQQVVAFLLDDRLKRPKLGSVAVKRRKE